jgi:DNA-binding NarL/FixJ family response regulator
MKVLLSDDSGLILERLQKLVKKYSNIEILGSFTNGSLSEKQSGILKHNMAILEIKTPAINGQKVLNDIRNINILGIMDIN